MKKVLRSFYLLLGEDDIRSDEFIADLESTLKREGISFEKEVLHCDEIPREQIIEEIVTPSLFFAKRILVLKNFSLIAFDPLTAEEILPLFRRLARMKDSPSVVIVKWVWSREAERLIKNWGLSNCVENFYRGKDWAIKKELRAKARDDGYQIDEDALTLLLEYAGEDYTQVYQEYEKVKTFTDKKVITCKILDEVVSPTKRYSLYELAKAFENKERRKALTILNNLLGYKRLEVIIGYITGLLLRMLSREKSEEASRGAPIPWRRDEIARRLKELYEVDKNVKTQSGDKGSLLLRWLAKALG